MKKVLLIILLFIIPFVGCFADDGALVELGYVFSLMSEDGGFNNPFSTISENGLSSLAETAEISFGYSFLNNEVFLTLHYATENFVTLNYRRLFTFRDRFSLGVQAGIGTDMDDSSFTYPYLGGGVVLKYLLLEEHGLSLYVNPCVWTNAIASGEDTVFVFIPVGVSITIPNKPKNAGPKEIELKEESEPEVEE
ncbi:MAG: hypothetical protein PQJ46_03955 [Spirochaetales bacterium]|nr:hypothetical protein [Spirochaetales bacterium]